MVIIFDLDDTLYDERTFMLGGFQAVAKYLSPILKLDSAMIISALVNEVKIARENVFDRFLAKQGIVSKRLTHRCISVYRGHKPHIILYHEAIDCLKRLRKYPLYVVTDGNKIIQRKKCQLLGLDTKVKRYFCTNDYGLVYNKPSPYCFQKICALENIPPSRAVYVADNPNKDFIGIKPLGFHTIRVMTGRYRQLELDAAHEAELRIQTLAELNESLLRCLT
jgi:putative hydrolase of the HAD superfamily